MVWRVVGIVVCSVLLSHSTVTVEAQSREEAALWLQVKDSNNPDDFRAYLDTYPNGVYAPLAKRRVETMLEAKRASLGGSEWVGKRYYRSQRMTQNQRFVQPTDPSARIASVTMKFADNGMCMAYNSAAECTWKKTADSISITLKKAKEHCAQTFDLTMAKQNSELTGTVHIGCASGPDGFYGDRYVVTLERQP